MSEESVGIQLARLDERFTQILRELEESKTGRAKQYTAIEGLRVAMADIGRRVGNVEDKLATTAPTIEEFVSIKNKVIGAGALGKWLWMLLGVVLGAVVTGKLQLQHLFKGS